jgi:hypothetical protein
MPAPHEIECPVCFATLKLKTQPKPGSKLRCPKCNGMFSPDGEPVESLVSSDDDDDIPASRPKGRVAGKSVKKKKSKPVNWQLPALIGGAVLLLVAVGIGIFFLLQNLPKGPPSVDLAFCRLEQANMFGELRPAELLQSAAVPQDAKSSPAMTQFSSSLKELIGIELADVDVIQAQGVMAGAFNPMQPRAAPTDQLIILTSKKPVTRPQSEQVDVEGVPCYFVHAEPPTPDFQNMNTMFFANATTVVLGNEPTIRGLLAKWKAGTPPAGAAFISPGGTIVMYVGGNIVQEAVQSATANPMLGAMGGPQGGGLGDDVKQTGEVLKSQAAGFSVSIKCATDIAMSIAVHGRDASGAQQIQSQLDGLRPKILQAVTQFEAFMPPESREGIGIAKQVLATPVGLTGDRVSVTFSLPASQQTTAMQGLTSSSPMQFSLKLGRGTATPTATPPLATSPGQ